MQKNNEDNLFCNIAIKLGHITPEQASLALRTQQEHQEAGQNKRIGAYLFDMQYLSREQIGGIIQEQYHQMQSTSPQSFPMEFLNLLIDAELTPQSVDESTLHVQSLLDEQHAEQLENFIRTAGLADENN